MRLLPTAALLLPLVTAEQFQIPFSSQFNNLWSSIAGYIPNTPGSIPTSFSSSSRAKPVLNLTAQNWATELGADTTKPWLILVTGGNQTCGTHNSSCARLDAAWTTASAAARTDSKSPKLGWINCEDNRLLCATWGAFPGTVWWVEPEVTIATSKSATEPKAKKVTVGADKVEVETPLNEDDLKSVQVSTYREVWIVGLNRTTVAPGDITDLYRKKDEYKNRGHILSHEDLFSRHPFSGQLAKLGLNVPLGYVLFVVGMMPSWTAMMIISFTARLFINRAKGPTPAQKAAQAEKERKAKYQENGKVRGAPPGDATY